jgi:hypothetical protein
VGLSAGLPKIIPGVIRLRIREGNPAMIRGALSVLQMYRVIKCPTQLKLETITDPFKGQFPTLPSFELRQAMSRLGIPQDLRGDSLRILTVDRLTTSTSAGPNSKQALFGLNQDLPAWLSSGKIANLYNYLQVTHSYPFLQMVKSQVETLVQFSKSSLTEHLRLLVPGQNHLGRLSIKEEPAGKARVFAITDTLTQSALRPLHDYLFSLLKCIPSDGTFNQSRPLEYLLESCRGKSSVKFFSYDLSAATDRLPLTLQRDILSLMFGLGVADA